MVRLPPGEGPREAKANRRNFAGAPADLRVQGSGLRGLLGVSWVVVNGVISPLI